MSNSVVDFQAFKAAKTAKGYCIDCRYDVWFMIQETVRGGWLKGRCTCGRDVYGKKESNGA